VPALDTIALIAMTVMLAIAGAFVMKR